MDAAPFTITITTRITEFDTTSVISAFLSPEDKRPVEVNVYGPREQFGTLAPATVNWSALGSQSPATAATYARLLTKAAEVAADMNRAAGIEA
jgi:hypothetical protein